MGALTLDRSVEIIAEGIEDYTDYGPLVDRECERHGGIREAVDEVQCTVDGVTHECRSGSELLSNLEGLFAQEQDTWEARSKA